MKNNKQLAHITPIVKPKSPRFLKPHVRSSKQAKVYNKLDVSEDLVNEVGRLNKQIDNLKTQYTLKLNELQEQFKSKVKDLEQSGECVTTLACHTDNYEFKLTRKDQYTKIDMSEETALHSALGDDLFFNFVIEKTDVKLKADIDIELLQQVLVESGHNPDDFITTRTYLTMHNETIERRANLSHAINEHQLEYLDELIDSLRYSPSISKIKVK